MDKIHEYVKHMHFKNAIMGGFDKESVYKTLKDLVALFETEITAIVNENKQLENIIQGEKKIQDDDSEQVKRILSSYRQLEKQLIDLKKENQEKDIMIDKIKGQIELERVNLQKQSQELKIKHDDSYTIELIRESYQKSVDILTQEFYQKNQKLVTENKRLKEQLEIAEKHNNNDSFQNDMEDLMNSMNRLKEKYLKDD